MFSDVFSVPKFNYILCYICVETDCFFHISTSNKMRVAIILTNVLRILELWTVAHYTLRLLSSPAKMMLLHPPTLWSTIGYKSSFNTFNLLWKISIIWFRCHRLIWIEITTFLSVHDLINFLSIHDQEFIIIIMLSCQEFDTKNIIMIIITMSWHCNNFYRYWESMLTSNPFSFFILVTACTTL